MMAIGTRDLLKSKGKAALRLAAKHGARNARIFGSAARGEDERATDVDFLVEIEQERSFLELAGPWQDLQGLLGREIDVMTGGGMSSYCHDRLYAEATPL
jgi:predicted nucleotidyltransferase